MSFSKAPRDCVPQPTGRQIPGLRSERLPQGVKGRIALSKFKPAVRAQAVGPQRKVFSKNLCSAAEKELYMTRDEERRLIKMKQNTALPSFMRPTIASLSRNSQLCRCPRTLPVVAPSTAVTHAQITPSELPKLSRCATPSTGDSLEETGLLQTPASPDSVDEIADENESSKDEDGEDDHKETADHHHHDLKGKFEEQLDEDMPTVLAFWAMMEERQDAVEEHEENEEDMAAIAAMFWAMMDQMTPAPHAVLTEDEVRELPVAEADLQPPEMLPTEVLPCELYRNSLFAAQRRLHD